MKEKSSGSRSRKQILTAVGTRCADHVTPLYPQRLALTSPTGGGRSVGIVRVRTKATELLFGNFNVSIDLVLLRAFTKLRKATISFVMSVCPAVPIEQLGSNWKDFH